MALYEVTYGPTTARVQAADEHDAWCKFLASDENAYKFPKLYERKVVLVPPKEDGEPAPEPAAETTLVE